jgi:hypothetical protein
MSIYDRVVAGEYEPKIAYPERPKKPTILAMRIDNVSAEELATVPAVKAAYEADVLAYDLAKAAYGEESRRLSIQFSTDLEVEAGVSGHPRAPLLYQLAYDRGHSAGMAEVALYYAEMAELIVGTKLVSE